MTYDGLIVGLGNPGAKYARTRHNFGFMLADRLVDYWSGNAGTRCERLAGKVNAELWRIDEDYGAKQWLLVKPQTFMNLSGQAVGELCRKNAIRPENILVLHDELDLALGIARFKFSGGFAGHNGLKSIGAYLGTKDFGRMRLGIGRPQADSVVDYVLKSFLPDEWAQVHEVLAVACDAVLHWCREGIEASTMRLHSR